VETPKSGKSRRVDLSQHLTETLRTLRVEQRREALRSASSVPTRLFPGLDPDNFRHREWRRIIERSGLRHVPMKALRHTFASRHIAQDESLAYVRDQLGHSSMQVTVDVYGHLVPGGNRGAADRLDSLGAPDAHPNAPQAHSPKSETR
jgi:integrase